MQRENAERDELQLRRAARDGLAMLLIAIGLLVVACAETKEPISRTPNDKCLVRACSVYY